MRSLGDGVWVTYSEPLAIERKPGLVLSYRATDVDGNVSDVERLNLRPGPPGRVPGPPEEN